MTVLKSLLITILLIALLKPLTAKAQAPKDKAIGQAAQQMHLSTVRAGATVSKNNSAVRSELGLEDYRAVAKMILDVQKSMTEEYAVGDGLTLVSYILKTFADIGDYDLSRDEILAMIGIFEKLTSLPVPEEAMEILHQIDFLRFSKINGQKTVEIRTLDPAGIKIVPEASEEEGGGSLDIEYILLQNGSRIAFIEMTHSTQKQEIIEFMKDAFKVPLLPTRWFKKFNQITPGVSSAVGGYLQQKRDAMPLKLGLTGMVMRVDTQSVLGMENFEFQEAYTTPGLTNSTRALPSFHLWMKSRTLKVKSSIEY